MPYVFIGLVIVNIVALGYFTLMHELPPTQTLNQAKAELTKPISFENSSKDVPPLIGTKK